MRGRADDSTFIVAPDERWALIVPPVNWGRSCYEASRAFRISLEESELKRSLDTPPKPRESLCDDEDRDYPTSSADMAISPDSELYAFVSEHILALYRATDDVKIASAALRSAGPGIPNLSFSRSGRFLVLYGESESAWYEIVKHHG